ncbi:MAG TPA: hypothetical protein VNZ03_23620 [Terriglobales bacterium]|jgi:hypothetical protein|nr:hypothetical protein [Terriglobales bacterium]
MAAKQTALWNPKSIAGAVLALLGMFILYDNLSGAVARLSQVIGNSSRALGRFPAFVLALSQAAQSCTFCRQQFLQGLFHQLLVSSWPLLLVIFGALLSTESNTDESKACPTK